MICEKCGAVNPNGAIICSNCNAQMSKTNLSYAESKRKAEAEAKRKAESEENKKREFAKQTGDYEYDVVTVVNTRNGLTDVDAIKKILARKSSQGWRLIAAYSNELGKNALGVLGFGTNTTASQDVLYFERKIN